jgi:hypothetical protein
MTKMVNLTKDQQIANSINIIAFCIYQVDKKFKHDNIEC